MNPVEIGKHLAITFNGPGYTDTARALLYAKGKREDIIRDESCKVLQALLGAPSARTELPLTLEQVKLWNGMLREHELLGTPGGLKGAKKRGRVDVAVQTPSGAPIALAEIKAWSATDAVDRSRYLPSKTYNHSLLKSFEVDALKLVALRSPAIEHRFIVTAMFTIHCDGLTLDQLKRLGLAYPTLNNSQNRDSAGVGNSDAYRTQGVSNIVDEFRKTFGQHPAGFNAAVEHVPIFGRQAASYKGVCVSLDLVIAALSL